MRAIEADNEDLKDVLPKTYNQARQGTARLAAEELLPPIPMDIEGDAFGKIYEYFLGKFAMTEGQKGGEFFTPTSIVKLIVEIIEPFHGRIFDPACGSGGMFVQSAAFVERTTRSSHRHLDLRPGEGRRDHPAVQDEPRRPRTLWRHSSRATRTTKTSTRASASSTS